MLLLRLWVGPMFPMVRTSTLRPSDTKSKNHLKKNYTAPLSIGNRLMIRQSCRSQGKGIWDTSRSCVYKFWIRMADWGKRRWGLIGGIAAWGLGKRGPQQGRGIDSGRPTRETIALHCRYHRADLRQAEQKPSLENWGSRSLSTLIRTDPP